MVGCSKYWLTYSRALMPSFSVRILGSSRFFHLPARKLRLNDQAAREMRSCAAGAAVAAAVRLAARKVLLDVDRSNDDITLLWRVLAIIRKWHPLLDETCWPGWARGWRPRAPRPNRATSSSS